MSKKKIALIVLAVVVVIAAVVAVVVLTKEPVVEGTLSEIMTKLYAGIPDEEKPMVTDVEITEELEETFFGTTELNYVEALASEPPMSSIAHSVMLIRFESAKEAEAAVSVLESSLNPRKWFCVEAEKVSVNRIGDLVLAVMSREDLATKIEANFGGLK